MKRAGSRRIAGLTMAMIVLLVPVAPGGAASSPAQATGQLAEVTIALADLANFNNLPVLLADSLGYFKTESVKVNVLSVSGGAVAVQAVVAGQADFGFLGLDGMINLRAAGKDVKAVAVTQWGLGQALVVSKDITSVDQLKGKTLGMSSFGSVTHLMTEVVLHKYNIPRNSVNLVPVGLSQTFIAAMQTRRIDGGTTVEPWVTYVVKKGLGHVLVDAVGAKGTGELYGGSRPHQVLWTRTDYLRSNPSLVEKVLRAVARANTHILNTPFEQLKPQVPKVMLGDDPDLALTALQNLIPAFSPTIVATTAGVQRALDSDVRVIKVVAEAVQKGTLRPSDVIDMTIAAKVAKDLGLPSSPE